LRKVAARTIETLTAAAGNLLEGFTTEECANYFANSEYAQIKIVPLQPYCLVDKV
jgi:hypothetical protein